MRTCVGIVVLCSALALAAASKMPEEASSSDIEQRLQDLEELALESGVVFNERVARLFAGVAYARSIPDLADALTSETAAEAFRVADQYSAACSTDLAECPARSRLHFDEDRDDHGWFHHRSRRDSSGVSRFIGTFKHQRDCLSRDYSEVSTGCKTSLFAASKFASQNRRQLRELALEIAVREHHDLVTACSGDLASLCGITVPSYEAASTDGESAASSASSASEQTPSRRLRPHHRSHNSGSAAESSKFTRRMGSDIASMGECIRHNWYRVSDECKTAVHEARRAGKLPEESHAIFDPEQGFEGGHEPRHMYHRHHHFPVFPAVAASLCALIGCCIYRRRRRRGKRCCRHRGNSQIEQRDAASEPVQAQPATAQAIVVEHGHGVTYIPTVADSSNQRLYPVVE